MNRSSLKIRGLAYVLILLFCLPLGGFAADAGSPAAHPQDRFKLDLYLYFWPAGLDGDVTAGTHTAHTSIKFDDIIHDLKMGAEGAFKISKGDWFLLNDFLYMDVSHKTSENIASIPGASVDATLGARVLTDLVAVGRQWQNPVAWNLFGGARYFYGRLRLDAIEHLGPINPEAIIVKKEEWATPTIGASVNLPMNDKLSFNFLTDIGAGDRSFNWEVIPTFSWKFNDTFSAQAGYRLLDIRHKEENFKIDSLMHGPIVGMKISF